MPEQHTKFSPSGAPRWLRCPGSISLEALAPPEKSGPYAQEGTDAHDLAEKLLRVRLGGNDGADIEDYQAALEVYTEKWGPEMEGFVQEYVDNILAAGEGAEQLLVEECLDYSGSIGVPEQFGTGDAVILKGDTIEVHDLKYGKGVQVFAENNEQLMCYGLGALETYDILGEFEKVKLVIHQVRLGSISEWECSVDELRSFANDLKRAARLALSEDPPFYPGEIQCRWCKGKAICQHAAAHASEVTMPAEANEFADISVKEFVEAMPVEQFEAYYAKTGFVKEWLAAMHERALAEAMNGTLTQYKAVTGRAGPRKWASEAEAEKMMKSMRLKKDEMYDQKVISPTTAEKLLKESPRKWGRLTPLITKSEGKPTVVPAEDKRPALSSHIPPEAFDDLTASDDDDLA